MQNSKLGLLAVSLVLVVGCGGTGGERDVEDFTPVPQAPDFQSISGDVQGLTGLVTLGWGSRTQVLSGGAFNIAQAFDADDDVNLTIVNEPFSQRCTIDTQTSFPAQADDITGVMITCITQNLIRVSVEDFATGTPMAGIDVTATWDQGGQQTMAGVSDAQGLLTFEVPTFDGRIIVNADPVGYGEQSKVVTNTAIPAGRVARMLMQPNDLGTTFDSAVGADLTVGADVLISIPANAFVDAGGAAYNGTVTTELTIVDPSDDVELMPGDYMSRDGGGVTSPIQSTGALSVTFTGAAGEVLDLAPGQMVDVNIPVAQAELGSPPAATPIFYYDPITGYWTEEGQAVHTVLGSGLQVFVGQVTHFTTWNADQEFTPVFVDGCVVDLAGAPYPNVRVNATGATYLGASRDITDAGGNFSIPVRSVSDVLVTVGDGLQSSTEQVFSGAGGATITPCLVASPGASTLNLTWGANPADLDTRFYGFSSADSDDDFAVNFTQRSVAVNNITIDLDVDDVSGFGPEIVTIPDFPFPGVYRYAVHLFSGSSDIQQSPARVELNLRGQVSVFTPPQGQPTACWAVLDITVDQSGNAVVTPIDTWEAEGYCNAGQFPRPI